MKVLYISELDIESKFGGAVMEKRTYNILKELYDVEVAGVYEKEKDRLSKIINLLFSPIPILYSKKDVNKLKKLIKKTDADFIFIESSRLGYLVKYAKKCQKKVLVFFHNCEYMFYKQQDSKIYKVYLKNTYKQEKMSLKYADMCYILNERDKEDIESIYKMKINNYCYLTVTFEDRVTNDELEYMKNKEKGNKGLFLGSLCTINYDGVKWFDENVADKINAKIDIVGLNFEKHNDFKNVNVIGTVDDVSKYLVEADFIISPIFAGSGMKVKTCEALMYGKKVFATDEALVGYKEEKNAYVRCNNKEEFIKAINDYVSNYEKVFVDEARNLFLNNYSNEYFKKELVKSIERVFDL